MEGAIGVGKGEHRTYFVDGGIIKMGTPHNIERKVEIQLYWVVGSGLVRLGLVGSVIAGNDIT